MVKAEKGKGESRPPLIDVYVNCLTMLQCNISIGRYPSNSSHERNPE